MNRFCSPLASALTLSLLLLAGWGQQGMAQDNAAEVVVTNIVAAKNPERFGAHLGFAVNKPTYLDTGMEGTNFRWRFVVQAGTTNSFSAENLNIWDTVKDGFFDGSTAYVYRLENQRVRFLRKATVREFSTSRNLVTLAENGLALQKGDHVFLNGHWDNAPIKFMADRLTWARDPWVRADQSTATGTTTRDSTTKAPINGGRSSLKLTATSAGEFISRTSGAQFDGAGQGYYPTLETGKSYRVSLWMKQNGVAGGNATFQLTSVYRDIHHTWNVGNEWKEYSFDFVAPAWPGTDVVSEIQLKFNGPGTLWVDNIAFYNTEYPAFAPDPRQVEALKEFKIGSMRTFGAFNSSQTLETWTDEVNSTSIGWDINNGPFPLTENKLPSFLRVCQQAQGIPWLVVGGQINEDEWPQLLEYLGAPYDPAKDTPQTKPYAFKRYSQGQREPWTNVFPKIRIEYGNESWNSIFQPWAYDSSTYGQFAQYFFNKAKSSPHYNQQKYDFVLNGWVIQTDENGYGQQARKYSPDGDAIDTTAYVGGWERGIFVGGDTLNDAGFQDTLLFAAYDAQPMHSAQAKTRDELAAKGFPYELMIYEAGPSYSLPNGGQPYILVQQQYGKSLAAGVCTLDMFLFNSLHGYTAQNYFTFSYGYNWSSHALVARGGHPYPSWSALQLRNRYAAGDMVQTQTLRSPTVDVVRPKENLEVHDIPLIQTYAFKDGNKFSVFVLSRRLDKQKSPNDSGITPVTLRLPFVASGKTTLHKLTGDPRLDNLDAYNIRESAPENVANVGSVLRFDMPPGSVYVYEFENTTPLVAATAPKVTVSAASGQDLNSQTPSARWVVAFDRSVKDFGPQSLVFNGTANREGAEISVEELEPTLKLKSTYLVTLRGLLSAGTVGLTVPAGKVSGLTGATTNLVSTGSSLIQYSLPEPKNQILAQESFDLAPDKAPHAPFLADVSSGQGWANAWQVQNFEAANYGDGYKLSSENPLTFGNLSTTLTYAVGGRRYEGAFRQLDTSAFGQNQAFGSKPGKVGQLGTSLWVSVLLRKEKDNDNPIVLDLANDNQSLGGEERNSRIAFGYFGKAGENEAGRFWSMRFRNAADDGWTIVKTNVLVEAGKTALLVARLDFRAQSKVALYVNPAVLGGTAPTKADAELTLATGTLRLEFRTVGFYPGSDLNMGAFDELRFGDSFAAVTPVAR